MSREILAFGLFAPLAMAYAAASFARGPLAGVVSMSVATGVVDGLRAAVALTGAIGVFCSVLIYHATRRAVWSAPVTGFKFLMTAALLGLATTILTFTAGSAYLHDAATRASVAPIVSELLRVLVGASLLKAAGELAFFAHLRDKRYTEAKRSAVLMTRDLAGHTGLRFALLALGGVLLPLVAIGTHATPLGLGLAGAIFASLVVAEIVERVLFFAAASAPGMPGGV
jgi:DMSO reductase anchor subunit